MEFSSREEVPKHQMHKMLTASELGDLFANYLGDTMSICVFEHFLEVVEDEDIKQFILLAKSMAEKHVQAIKEMYMKEAIPMPRGFGEEDIHRNVPRLFSDTFMLFYIRQMSRAGLSLYGSAFSMATRQDVIDYFKGCLEDTVETNEKAVKLLLFKGVDFVPPTIPYPKKSDFVEKKSFISMITGKTRPLTGLEIKHVQTNLNTNVLGKALMVAFAQVTPSKELISYFRQGAMLAGDQIKELNEIMISNNLSISNLLDVHISDSTTPPFSNKLMLYHAGLATASAIENIGSALSQVMRHDISLKFAAISASIGKYANDGMNLMIENGWLEEPPTSADRQKLSNVNPE